MDCDMESTYIHARDHSIIGPGSTEEWRRFLQKNLVDTIQYGSEAVTHNVLSGGSGDVAGKTAPSRHNPFVDKLVSDIVANNASCKTAIERICALSVDKKDKEREYYPCIDTILAYIESETAKTYKGHERPYSRKIVFRGEATLSIDDSMKLAPIEEYSKPDYVLVEVATPAPGLAAATPPEHAVQWRHCPAFMEVKAKGSDTPLRTRFKEKGPNMTLAQGADYSRYVFTGRPYQRFTYGIYFCGALICVGFHDHCGIVLSDSFTIGTDHDGRAGLRKFVRLILRLTWEMSPVELGVDPTMQLLPGQTFHQQDYPSFRVTMMEPPSQYEDYHSWATTDPPMFVSQSLIGRATVVWPAYDEQTHTPAVVKTAWRTIHRNPESMIYRQMRDLLIQKGLNRPDLGITIPCAGGDVHFQSKLLTARCGEAGSLQVPPPSGPDNVEDRILHRIVLPDLGKPLYDFSSPLEFLFALKHVVRTHETLSEAGIIHRDISIGNILIKLDNLTQDPHEPGAALRGHVLSKSEVYKKWENVKGILTDFEFAKLRGLKDENYHDMVVVQQRDTDAELREAWSGSGASEPTHARFEPRLKGDGLTGTALFFATEVLAAYVNKQSVSRDTHHDLESFCWVIVYAIYKNSIDRVDISLQSQPDAQLKDLRNQLYQECKLIFGSITPSDLFNQRKLVLEFPPGEDEEDESIYRYVWKLHVFLEEDAAGDKMPLVAILRWAWVALKTRPRQPREESASGKRDTRQKLRLHQKEVLRDFKPDSTKSALGTLTHAMFIKGIDNALEV